MDDELLEEEFDFDGVDDGVNSDWDDDLKILKEMGIE